jgi:hypothetical protein
MKKLWITLLLGIFLLAGCQTPQFTFQPLSQHQVWSFLVDMNGLTPHGSRIASFEYAAPSTNWVNRVFTPALKDYLFKNDLNQYVIRENDCVRFSVHAQSVAYTVYRHDHDRLPRRALPVGIFDYRPAFFGDGHEIIFFITSDGGRFNLTFYEPQRQKIVDLNIFDICSCEYFGL